MILEPDNAYTYLDEYPFSSERKMSMIQAQKGNEKITLLLGAYDILSNKLSQNFRAESRVIFEDKNLSFYRNLLFAKVCIRQTDGQTNRKFWTMQR